MRRILIPALMAGLMMLLSLAPISFAAETDPGAQASDETTYTVKVYPGLHGSLTKASEYSGHKYNEPFKGNLTIKDVKVEEGSRYYVKGFRLTGHDNKDGLWTSLSDFTVKEDLAYEVAYGIKGDMVAYTAKYVDENGKTIAPDQTFYGNVNDKPIVSYEYIKGYYPKSYTLGKTLSEEASENVFEFVYSKTKGTQVTPVNQTAPGRNANNAAAAAGNNAAPAGNNAAPGNADAGNANLGDNAVPLADQPSQYTDLDDGETPLAGPQDGTWGKLPLIFGGLAALILAAIAAVVLARRKRQAE